MVLVAFLVHGSLMMVHGIKRDEGSETHEVKLRKFGKVNVQLLSTEVLPARRNKACFLQHNPSVRNIIRIHSTPAAQ